MSRPRRSLAVLALLLFAAGAFAGDDDVPPLARHVRLNLWGAGLDDAAREIQAQTGVEVLFYRPDLPIDQNTDNLYLVSGDVELRAVLECLARRYSFRYRISETGKVELSKGYGWVAPDPVLRFQRLDGIVPPGGGDPKELRKFLGEFVKSLPLLPGDFSLTIEKYPAPGNPNSLRCIAVLPAVLADYLEKAVLCLGGDGGDFPPSPARPRNHLFAAAWRPPGSWENLLGRRVETPGGGDLRAILASVCAQAGIAVVISAPPVPGGAGTAQAAAGGRGGLGGLAEDLAARYHLGKRAFLAAGAIVFEPGAGNEWELDDRSRELFWSGLAVAGFDAKATAGLAGSGSALVARIGKEVFPGLWRDPVCAIGYSQATGRLAVIAPENAIGEIAKKLGEWNAGAF